MKPRWAPRWFQYVGLDPNPLLPQPIGDSMPRAFLEPKAKEPAETSDFCEPTYVWVAIAKASPDYFLIFKTEHWAKQWISLNDGSRWRVQAHRVHEDEE